MRSLKRAYCRVRYFRLPDMESGSEVTKRCCHEPTVYGLHSPCQSKDQFLWRRRHVIDPLTISPLSPHQASPRPVTKLLPMLPGIPASIPHVYAPVVAATDAGLKGTTNVLNRVDKIINVLARSDKFITKKALNLL